MFSSVRHLPVRTCILRVFQEEAVFLKTESYFEMLSFS